MACQTLTRDIKKDLAAKARAEITANDAIPFSCAEYRKIAEWELTWALVD